MRFKKCLHLAFNIFVHSKLRSWLTIIGIIVGIAAVVGIVSMSLSLQQQMQDQLGSLGANILTVTPGASRAFGGGFGGGDRGPPGSTSASISSDDSKNLTKKDIIVIKSLANVELVMGQVSGKDDVVYSGKTASDTSITGVDISAWKDITTETLSSGRFLSSGDMYSVVIGENIAETVFDKAVPINTKIIIGGKSFNVVGILSDGRGIYMPIQVARDLLDDVGEEEFDSISVKIKDVSISNETTNLIKKKLMLARGILKEADVDFSVSNPATMQATMQESMGILTYFLAAIAAISLLVGAIGIANTMFTSVLEQTRDIGILKAIGAQNKDVMTIFLLNSGLIGLVGGIGGAILGMIVSVVINSFVGISSSSSRGIMSMFGSSSVSVNFYLIFGSILFAVVIGMVAGAIPAYKASRLNPVDALRYG
jgi:putative ABC transport system permease protein